MRHAGQEEQTMGEREALIKDLDGEYETLYGALMSLSDADKVRPMLDAWSVKDILAHIAAWLREGTRALEALARGEQATPESLVDDDVDARNDRFVEQWRGASVQDVQTELHLAKDAFSRAMRALPQEAFAEGEVARRIVCGEGIDHFSEHARQIWKWKERGNVGRPVPPGMPREAMG
jgi:hypothetical protein